MHKRPFVPNEWLKSQILNLNFSVCPWFGNTQFWWQHPTVNYFTISASLPVHDQQSILWQFSQIVSGCCALSTCSAGALKLVQSPQINCNLIILCAIYQSLRINCTRCSVTNKLRAILMSYKVSSYENILHKYQNHSLKATYLRLFPIEPLDGQICPSQVQLQLYLQWIKHLLNCHVDIL